MRASIRQAGRVDADRLSAIAVRSKAHWGYDEEFIAQCADELRVEPDVRDYFVADVGTTPVGFYGIEATDSETAELEALFVDPDWIGHGIGTVLFHHAVDLSRMRGFNSIVIQSDPHASGFYESLGCTRTGERESGSIPGRSLPIYTFKISTSEAVPSC